MLRSCSGKKPTTYTFYPTHTRVSLCQRFLVNNFFEGERPWIFIREKKEREGHGTVETNNMNPP
jgi:hypothetical protein